MKIPYLATFRLELEKTIIMFDLAPSVCQNVIFLAKNVFKYRTKIVLFGYFCVET